MSESSTDKIRVRFEGKAKGTVDAARGDQAMAAEFTDEAAMARAALTGRCLPRMPWIDILSRGSKSYWLRSSKPLQVAEECGEGKAQQSEDSSWHELLGFPEADRKHDGQSDRRAKSDRKARPLSF
jgi:hypothetical protein